MSVKPNSKATAVRGSHQRRVLPRPSYEITARYGNTTRLTKAPDLIGVWAVAAYEITHGAVAVTIEVKRQNT